MRKVFLLVFLLFSFWVQAKKTAVFVKFSSFMDSQQETYLELYFTLNTATLDLKPSPQGKFYGGLEATVTIYQDSNFVTGDKFRILSPAYADTTKLDKNLLHQHRLVLPAGNYRLQLDMADIHEPSENYRFTKDISINLEPNAVQTSELFFLESYKPAAADSRYARSGYEILPIITSGNQYFPETEDKLAFYVELYNLDKQLGPEGDYLLKYYLEDAATDRQLPKFSSFSRKKAQTVEPVLASFRMGNLPTGNYNLVVEAINTKGQPILQKRAFFFRKNNMAEVADGSFENVKLNDRFTQEISNVDSLYKYVDYLYPISSDREQTLQQSLLESGNEDRLRRYFTAFWQLKHPLNPWGAWRDYHEKVRIANKLYRSGMRQGYRSDRGRVYLTYGAPDQVDKREMEPNMPPYEIWHYKRINTPYTVPQTNRIFIFGEFEASSKEYQLFHSTALGELQSRNWRQDLYFKAYGGPGSIDPAGVPNSSDREFGSRANQNIILQSTGSERSNR